jgi:hypothetical protein
VTEIIVFFIMAGILTGSLMTAIDKIDERDALIQQLETELIAHNQSCALIAAPVAKIKENE